MRQSSCAYRQHRPAPFWGALVLCVLMAGPAWAQRAPGPASGEDARLDAGKAATPLREISGLPAPPSQPTRVLEPPSAVRALCEQARKRLEDGELGQAVIALDEALQTSEGDYYEPHYLLALAKYRLGRFGEARIAAERAARLRHGAADVHFLLGMLHLRQGQLDAAISHFRTATLAAGHEGDNPCVTAAWCRLGECLQRAGYLLAAAEAYERFDVAIWETHSEHRSADEVAPVLAVHPRGVLELQLELYRRLERHEDAVRAAERALQREPGDGLLERIYVRVLLEAGQADRVLEYCQERLQDWPAARGLLPVAVEAARASGHLGNWVAAAEEDIAADRDIDLAVALAEQLGQVGAYAEAERVWRTLFGKRRDDANIAWALATTQNAASNLSSAFETLCGFVRDHAGAGEEKVDLCPPPQRLTNWLESFAASDEVLEFIGERSRAQRDFAADFVLGTMAAAVRQPLLAEKLFGSCLDAEPQSALAHVVWGRTLLSAYQWEPAKAHAARALEVAPDSAAAHLVLAEAQAGLDENDDAEESYKAAMRLAPDDLAYPVALAQFLRRLGRDLGAQRYFQQALTIDPANTEAVEGLIESYLKDGKAELARTQLERAEQSGVPQDVLRRCGTALQFLRAPFREEHLSELAEQFERFPEDTRTGLQLAAGLWLRHRLDEAFQVAEKVRAHAPDDYRLMILLPRLHMRRLEYDQAIEILERLLSRYPNRREVLALLATAYLSDFRLTEARDKLGRVLALELDEDARHLRRLQLLTAYVEFSEFDDALELLDSWLEQEPDNEQLVNTKQGVLIDAGRGEEAVKIAWQRLDDTLSGLQPLIERADDPREQQKYHTALVGAYKKYLDTCVGANELEQGERNARAWLADSPNDPRLAEKLMLVLLRDERPDEALDVLEEFTPQTWDVAVNARIWRGRCLAAAGRVDDAMAEFDALLAERMVRTVPEVVKLIREQMWPALVDAEQYDRALKLLAKWEQELPPRPSAAHVELLTIKRIILQAAGRIEEYAQVAESLLEHAPGDPGLNNDLGYTWVDAGRNVERATEMIRRAVAAEPLNAAFLDSLGWAYYKVGDFAGARKYLARTVRLREGQIAVSYDHLADAEYRLGHIDVASGHWQKALELLEEASARHASPRDAELTAQVRAKLAALERSEPPAIAPTAAEQR